MHSNAACRHELDRSIRSGYRLQICDAAERFSRKKFQHFESAGERGLDLGRSRNSRKHGNLMLEAVIHDRRAEARCDDESCASIAGVLRLRGCENCACTGEHVRAFACQPRQRFACSCGSERHLSAGKSACSQCSSKVRRLAGIVDDDHRHQAMPAKCGHDFVVQ